MRCVSVSEWWATDHPSVRNAWVAGGCRQYLVEHAARLGIDMEKAGTLNCYRCPGG
ncbi:hypothetical protein HEK616_33930 [Streptomyces nigrescens]|uniref:Uncharacterized protein n=1 Tax=Streptomyces nigrescens TaxID=1920 RepID=A0ABM7ZU79_STRNI|nr:hypothetical protein HEK616_33930 [Streptomyces nigrescens]